MRRIRTSLRLGSAFLVIAGVLVASLAVIAGTASAATAQSLDSYSVEAVGSIKTVANVNNNLSDIAVGRKGRLVAAVNDYAVGDLKSSGSGYQMSARAGDLEKRTANFAVEGIDYLEGDLYAVTLEGKKTSELRIYRIDNKGAELKQTYSLPMPAHSKTTGAEGVVLQNIKKDRSGTKYTFLIATEGARRSRVAPQLYSFTVEANKQYKFSPNATKNWGPVALTDSADSSALEIDPKTGHLLVLTEDGPNYINVYELGEGTAKSVGKLDPAGPFTDMKQPEGLAFNPANANQLMVVGQKNEVLELRVNRSGPTTPPPGPTVSPTPPPVTPGETTVTATQDCYYYGDEGGLSLAGTAIQRHVVTISNGTNQVQKYSIEAESKPRYSSDTVAASLFNGERTLRPGETVEVPFYGHNPGEAFYILVGEGTRRVVRAGPNSLSCSVPMQQEGSRRVPTPREETLGVRIGGECRIGPPGAGRSEIISAKITNTTNSQKSYVVEWSLPDNPSARVPFQWYPNQSPGYSLVAQNYFTTLGSNEKQLLVLNPGESVPAMTVFDSGQRLGGIVGIRVIEGSSISQRSPGLYELSEPTDGREIFKATLRSGQCDGYYPAVEVIQDCPYKQQDKSIPPRRNEENRLRVVIHSGSVTAGVEGDLYQATFTTDTSSVSRSAYVRRGAESGIIGQALLADGQVVRGEIKPNNVLPNGLKFETRINACESAFDH